MTTTRLIRGGRILDARTHRAEAQDMLIIGERIADIAPPGLTVNDETAIVNANGMLLIPGLVNAHTHGHGSLAKGMGDRWTLELLLNANPWLNDGQTLEDKHLAAKLNAAEMVLKGATAAYDLFFEFPQVTREGIDAIARGYQSVGLRAVVAPMMADRTFYQAIPGLIDALPKDASWDDVMYRVYVRQRIESGIQDADAGRVVDVEEVRRQFGLAT